MIVRSVDVRDAQVQGHGQGVPEHFKEPLLLMLPLAMFQAAAVLKFLMNQKLYRK